MDIYNQTLHKRSLARKKMVLRMLNGGMRGWEVADRLGITPQRVYALAKAARIAIAKGRGRAQS